MGSSEQFDALLQAVAAHVYAYERRERSRAEKEYGVAMKKSADVLLEFVAAASFAELLQVERIFQENDRIVYAKRSATMKSVLEGIDDFAAGEVVYRQLVEDTNAYRTHKYRKKNSVDPDNAIPVDTMRQALRGQVRRVENYRKNVMGNLEEQKFMSARIAMLRRAEKLYDAMQRERLLPSVP